MPVRARTLLLAENDAGLGQIVRRKLHRDFVTRDDANEMLPHLAGDMSEDVALTGEIDSEHRPRQNLGHRAFHHDLFFLRHRAEIYSRIIVSQQTAALSILADIFERNTRQIFAKLRAFPPRAGFAMFLHRRKTVAIKSRANIARWTLWKRILFEQRNNFRFAMQQTNHRLN